MADTNNNASYAIANTDIETGELWYTAREINGTEPVQWMLVPD
jgi:hypothetical protein